MKKSVKIFTGVIGGIALGITLLALFVVVPGFYFLFKNPMPSSFNIYVNGKPIDLSTNKTRPYMKTVYIETHQRKANITIMIKGNKRFFYDYDIVIYFNDIADHNIFIGKGKFKKTAILDLCKSETVDIVIYPRIYSIDYFPVAYYTISFCPCFCH